MYPLYSTSWRHLPRKYYEFLHSTKTTSTAVPDGLFLTLFVCGASPSSEVMKALMSLSELLHHPLILSSPFMFPRTEDQHLSRNVLIQWFSGTPLWVKQDDCSCTLIHSYSPWPTVIHLHTQWMRFRHISLHSRIQAADIQISRRN